MNSSNVPKKPEVQKDPGPKPEIQKEPPFLPEKQEDPYVRETPEKEEDPYPALPQEKQIEPQVPSEDKSDPYNNPVSEPPV